MGFAAAMLKEDGPKDDCWGEDQGIDRTSLACGSDSSSLNLSRIACSSMSVFFIAQKRPAGRQKGDEGVLAC